MFDLVCLEGDVMFVEYVWSWMYVCVSFFFLFYVWEVLMKDNSEWLVIKDEFCIFMKFVELLFEYILSFLFFLIFFYFCLRLRVGVVRNLFCCCLLLYLFFLRSGKVVIISLERIFISLLWIRLLSKWLIRGWWGVYWMWMMRKWWRSMRCCWIWMIVR